MKNQIKREIEATSNQSKRHFTLRIKGANGKTVIKYRTISYSKEEFLEMEMNTNQDWNDYLRTSQSYFKIN